ncbi:MAG TPA: VTT domain-containing protein [Bacteroidia bacterium]|nr:VTT domain-containing protein [Bacteroidia bacterium]
MKRIAVFTFALITFFLLLFLLSPLIGLDFSEAEQWMKGSGGILAAFTGTTLLIIDFFLPVPSSLIMIYNGLLFGPYMGTLLSVAGGIGASLMGYYAGKSGKKYMLRFILPADIEKSKSFFDRWGLLVIAITRPVPLLSEAASVVAGMSGIELKQMFKYSLVGYLPPAIIYALTGAYAMDIGGGIISFLIVIGISTIAWLAGNFFQKRLTQSV